MNYDLITILGPTASGKTPLAAALAARLRTEIISGDSRQVYCRMDLGTGKDLADYVVDGHRIPYHLIDIVPPGYKYNVFEFQRDFLAAYDSIRNRGMLPILCGGTGMYLESVLKGYKLLPVPENPELRKRLGDKSLSELTEILSTYKQLHNSTDVDTVKRAIRAIEIEEYYLQQPVDARSFPELNSLIIGVDIDRELRREKISRRLRQRLDEGMVDEVRALLDSGIVPEDLIYYGLEYKYLTLYVTGAMTYEEMFRQLEIGKGRCLIEGTELAIISIGAIGMEAKKAIEMVKDCSVALYDMRVLKPIDEALLHDILQRFPAVITLEDGTIEGGLGSAVAEFIAEHRYNTRLVRLGIPDKFIEHGTQAQLYAECGYDATSISDAIRNLTQHPQIMEDL